MAWVLRLVETGIDGPARVIDETDIGPLGALGDIANLGLTLSEAKQILARLQQAVVSAQADDHAVLRPDCCIPPPKTAWDCVARRLTPKRCGCGAPNPFVI
ncbi:MAG: hypothetical protein QOF70_3005 [Acetobacteraceae bacterium]|jgi:hypothetical protein|nr:hypothetical protein [Acetobacteraceae bacterium]